MTRAAGGEDNFPISPWNFFKPLIFLAFAKEDMSKPREFVAGQSAIVVNDWCSFSLNFEIVERGEIIGIMYPDLS
ncbi:hypothetical protein A7J42_00780 [Brucella intermedia]|nr:hypothetical protein A7J42_00780 [Brucella intermedia]